MTKRSTIVVGGGMLGLVLAHRLAGRGERVTLLEAAPKLGGLASAWRLGDVTWDRHYHVTLLSDDRLRALLTELKLEAEMEWVETGTGCYAQGRLHSVSSALELLRFPPLRLVDTLRLAATVLWASRLRDLRRLEQIPVGDWTRRLSGRRTFEGFWLPLLRSKLGESWHETSAAFLWATIQRLYAARRQGIGRERFGFVPGGYARILSRFAELLVAEGVVLKTATAVARVVAEPGGGVRAELGNGAAVRADRAVVTLAAPLAARLVPGLSGEERRRCERVRYLGIVCASLLLDAPLSGFYVTNIVDPGFPFTGVIEMSALVDPQRFLGGHHLVYLPRYVTPEDEFFELSDPEIEARFVAGLERMFPAFERSRIRAFRISRVRQVCAIPTLGYSEHLPPTTTQVPGVYLLGSAHVIHGTLNVNETVKLAEEALATWLT